MAHRTVEKNALLPGTTMFTTATLLWATKVCATVDRELGPCSAAGMP